MAAVNLLHADALPLSSQIGYNCNSAGVATLLTNTTVAAADTNLGLQAAVTAAVCHADVVPLKTRINTAIASGGADGTLADSQILGLTTVAGLVALTNAGTSTNTGLFLE